MKATIAVLMVYVSLLASPYAHANCVNDNNSRNCTVIDLEEVESKLDQRYIRLMDGLPQKFRQSVEESRGLWGSYRDLVCDFETDILAPDYWYGKDKKNELRLNCLTRTTNAQVYEINHQIALLLNNTRYMGLDNAIDMAFNILTEKSIRSVAQMTSILEWVDAITLKIDREINKNFSQISEPLIAKKIFFSRQRIAVSTQDLRSSPEGEITNLDGELILINGDCKIAYASNSIIICTGNSIITHSSNNIVISNASIQVSNDGATGSGSLFVSRQSVKVLNATSSVFLFPRRVITGHSNNSICINTDEISASHEQCRRYEMRPF